jgi:hypothetical protein
MLETVLRDISSWHWFYLDAKPSHVGIDVDGLDCPLHRPRAYSHQTKGQSFLLGAALSHHAVVGGGAFLRVRSPWAWIFNGRLTV